MDRGARPYNGPFSWLDGRRFLAAGAMPVPVPGRVRTATDGGPAPATRSRWSGPQNGAPAPRTRYAPDSSATPPSSTGPRTIHRNQTPFDLAETNRNLALLNNADEKTADEAAPVAEG
jgi:hypothetical protein